jgi:predicted Zn-dependent peptidase
MEEQDKVAETLQKLKKLYESGLITQQEFENKKNEIINSL